MRRMLQVVRGKDVGREYDLHEDEILVGRGQTCGIAIIEPTVSRQHARLVLEGETYVIEDLNSRHHTFVNGSRIDGPVPLKHQDRITIGDTVFAFHAPQPVAKEKTEHRATTLLETIDLAGTGESTVRANAEAKLRAILQITQALGRTLELDALLPKMLDGLFQVFPQADRALVLLLDGDRLVPTAGKHRLGREHGLDYSKTIVQRAIADRQAILSEDAVEDERFPQAQSIQSVQIRSVMCVPLLSRDGNALGVIQLDTQRRGVKFNADDVHILASVACQASVSIEYAQLHGEMLKQAKLQKEMDIAHDVQHSFLPTATPELEGYEFWAYYLAAGKVGGDYYDFLHLPNGNLAALLGDVSGKGVPAALLMAKASAVCKVSLLNHADHLDKAMNAINQEICDASVDASFLTLVLCVINPRTHEITIANAGHMSPMLFRGDGSINEPADTDIRGYPLGIVRDSGYKTVSTTLAPGESVVLFSDGISEAMDSQEELYSIDRIREQLEGMEGKGPAEIGQALLEDVRRHGGDCEQSDDISLVVFQRVPG
jgi:serine phosphatase RsbU (regulator of sigma subunit)/pSer/pThr/pTyr-binding forkhead associated (FHA) protein